MGPSCPTINPQCPVTLLPEPLTPPSFSPFGTAITSPFFQNLSTIPIPPPAPKYRAFQPSPVVANQSTALKYPSISPLLNTYPGESKAQMSMFSCFPRRDLQDGIFQVKILERHPCTTQTFTPLGLSPSDSSTQFLIIVAPSITALATTDSPANPPDLSKVQAFIATGGQAVTYAAGTWHAPMVVLGANRVDFVVTQFVSGISNEDCQEVLVGNGVGVDVTEFFNGRAALMPAEEARYTPGPKKMPHNHVSLQRPHRMHPTSAWPATTGNDLRYIEELEHKLRTVEKHLHAERELTATLEEAFVDLDTQQNKTCAEMEGWRKNAWLAEAETEQLRRQLESKNGRSRAKL